MLQKLRANIAKAIMPKGVYNAFNDAFFSLLGINVTRYDQNSQSYIEHGYNVNSDVYSVISQIATKSSDIPFFIKSVKNEKIAKEYDLTRKSSTIQSQIKGHCIHTKAFEEKVKEIPLERPNPFQTWSEFIALSVTLYKLTGNCFWYKLTPTERENAPPLAMYALPSHLVYIVLKKNADFMGVESPIECYKLIEGNSYVEFRESDIIHIKNPNPNFDLQGSHLYGQSDLRAALGNIQSSNEAIKNNIKTLQNGGAFGFIHSKGANVMTSEQAKQIKERLKEMDDSPERLSKISGVSAELGFTRIALTTDELKPFDYLNYDQKAICNVLGWSVKLLNNNEDSTGINNGAMQEERKRVITDTVMPMLNKFEQAFQQGFLDLFPSTKGCVLHFDPSELPEMQSDMKILAEWANEAVDRGTINRDEWRAIMNFNQIGTPEMQAYTVSMNVIGLEDALIPLENELNVNE